MVQVTLRFGAMAFVLKFIKLVKTRSPQKLQSNNDVYSM